jgi:hypothetical protein
MPSSLHAIALLAWSLLRTIVRRLFGERIGLSLFRANYAADRLPPPSIEERAQLPRMSGCIACGLCEVGGRGPMQLALAGGRTSTDSDAAVIELARLDDEELRRREGLCPTRVPLVEIATLTRARARAVEAMR